MTVKQLTGTSKITDAQVADERYVYYTDNLLRLVNVRNGASWYTYRGRLWPLFYGTQTGENTYFLQRPNTIAGVAPSIAEVQLVYPSITSFGEGDNFVVQFSNGIKEYWDVILGALTLRYTDIPQTAAIAIEFRVDGCSTLQYRIGTGPWQTIAELRVRLDGGFLQTSLDPSATPAYCNAVATTTC